MAVSIPETRCNVHIRRFKLMGTAVSDRGIARITRYMSRLTQLALGESGTLQRVDLRPLWALRSIPRTFLADCANLRLLNVSCLTRLKKIGDSAFTRCPVLISANLSGLKKLESVGDRFKDDCTSLDSSRAEPSEGAEDGGKWIHCSLHQPEICRPQRP